MTDMSSSWSSSQQAARQLIWILCVGSVAARDMAEERSWFVAILRELMSKEDRIRKFGNLRRDVLNRILWLEQSCDGAGRLLWAEIVEKDGY